MSNAIQRLQTWFKQNCDEDWEHSYGVSIQTCDNPGWLVKIDVRDTPLEHRPFEVVQLGIGETAHPDSESWLHCHCSGGTWNGAGDDQKLEVILEHFLDWAEQHK